MPLPSPWHASSMPLTALGASCKLESYQVCRLCLTQSTRRDVSMFVRVAAAGRVPFLSKTE